MEIKKWRMYKIICLFIMVFLISYLLLMSYIEMKKYEETILLIESKSEVIKVTPSNNSQINLDLGNNTNLDCKVDCNEKTKECEINCYPKNSQAKIIYFDKNKNTFVIEEETK